jgi:hypothetical protein
LVMVGYVAGPDMEPARFTALMRVVVAAHDKSGRPWLPWSAGRVECLGSIGGSEDGGLWTTLTAASAVVDMVAWRRRG